MESHEERNHGQEVWLFMEEQDKRVGQLTRLVRRQLDIVAEHSSSPFSDFSITKADGRAHLADCQIQRSHINALCEEAKNGWPDIKAIACGAHQGRFAYIVLRISPYNDENLRRHTKFVDSVKKRLPALNNVIFYCLGEAPEYSVSADTTLYTR